MESDSMGIRVMRPEDVNDVVCIHLKAFQGFFLSFLGDAFLRQLYTAILHDPSGIAFVYEENDGRFGFVAGTDSPSGFYRSLLKQRWLQFGWASIGPVLRQPRIIPRLLRAFNMPKQDLPAHGCGTLMSIAVLPKAEGRGIGKDLVTAFLQEAHQRGLEYVNLTTDRLNNEPVNAFYQKLGFRCVRSYRTPENREMNEYMIELNRIDKDH
jgi:ribosomal protein S18 acetylase RimI-like enzyme